MNAEFFEAIEDIESEKGISREYLYEKIKQAMLAAFRRDNPECEDNVEIILDEEKKRIEMVVNKTVVDEVSDPTHEIILEAAKKISRRAKVGDILPVPVETKKFGRIAAQAAKQVIIQAIREAERGMIMRSLPQRSMRYSPALSHILSRETAAFPFASPLTVSIPRRYLPLTSALRPRFSLKVIVSRFTSLRSEIPHGVHRFL